MIATTSTEEKAALARGAGADETIRYEGFGERCASSPAARGVAVVYDAIGATTFEDGHGRAARARDDGPLRHGQRPGAGLRPAAPAGQLALPHPPRAAELHRHARGAAASARATCCGWIADGSLDVRIGERYPLEDARRAHEDLEARRSTGKLLLIP